MEIYRDTIEVQTPGKGMHEITDLIRRSVARSGIRSGICHLFLRHTSASLVINENADPSARMDLEYYFSRLVPENDPSFTHTAEGRDDMPSHIRTALTRTSETLFIENGGPLLGTWQGVFLFEHRNAAHRRILDLRVVPASS